MIPKIIHCCWFGNGEKSRLIRKCMDSWQEKCPEYTVMEWSENNFDLAKAPLYVRQAYESKKWAFVSDYVRLVALMNYGGIYLDTDVEVLKTLDPFLQHRAFVSTEDGILLSTAIIGSEKNFPLFAEFLSLYDEMQFLNPDGSMNLTSNVALLTEFCSKRGISPGEKMIEYSGLAVYPSEYFYPLSNWEGTMHKTENTATVHWFTASWKTKAEKREKHLRHFKKRIKRGIVAILGEKTVKRIKKLFRNQDK